MNVTPSCRYIIPLLFSILTLSCGPSQSDEGKLREFIAGHLKLVEPKLKAINLADWNANATGEKKYYDEKAALELEVNRIRSNKADFEFLKKLKAAHSIQDSLLGRQLELLYNSFLKNQIDTALMRKIVEQENSIANTFNPFRATVNGKQLSDNEILGILKSERNPKKRKAAWEGSKQVGREVALRVIELVKLRNTAARQLGYENYYAMALATDEQDATDVLRIFDELSQLTEAPFRAMKQDLDGRLAKNYGISPQDIRPWHYEDPFFQEAPSSAGLDFDSFIKGNKVEELAPAFYAGIGMPVEDILASSDIYGRAGKYQHAFCTDIDRLGDVRVMLSVTDNIYWMETMLHELGHGVYSKYVNRNLPFLLRVESHTFLTEAIAQLMERQAVNPDWLQAMVHISDKQKQAAQAFSREKLRSKELVFSRWSQVMVRFERSMYQNPDQDLNKLWWDLVEKYQFVKRPENRNDPDWAAKIHLVQYPCYYHNYMLGELAASQILNAILRLGLKQETFSEISFAGKPQVGDFLKEHVFRPGASYQWNDLLIHATGEGLTAKYFAEEFVR
jgi:peptidyl-dipeptidase A